MKTMEQRLSYGHVAPGVVKAMLGLENYVRESGLEPATIELAKLRVSQINGCTYCLAMHTAELRDLGEPNSKLDLVAAWREAPVYSPRERAALAWAEAVTQLEHREVPDDVYEEALEQFSEKELVDLTLAICAINSWNRLNVAFRTPPEHI